jgi:hypothetical protein
MSVTQEEIIPGMNATKVLVSILETVKSVDVKMSDYINSNKETRELKVDYNGDIETFTFGLKEIEVDEQ